MFWWSQIMSQVNAVPLQWYTKALLGTHTQNGIQLKMVEIQTVTNNCYGR